MFCKFTWLNEKLRHLITFACTLSHPFFCTVIKLRSRSRKRDVHTQFQNAFMQYLSSIFKHVTGCDVSKCNNNSTSANFKLSLALGKVSSKLLILYHKPYITAECLCPLKPVPHVVVTHSKRLVLRDIATCVHVKTVQLSF